METAAVVLAAGRGTRAASGSDAPLKQYRELGGRTVLARGLAAFADHHRIDAVLAVIHPHDRARYELSSALVADRLLDPALGGNTRQESVLAGLTALAEYAPRFVLLHDAARPFVSHAVIDRVIDALATHDGAVPTLPVTETLKRAQGTRIVETVDRTGLWVAQTPQGFRYTEILQAHRAAADAGQTGFTDDAGIAERFGLCVGTVEGAITNRKLTTEEDLSEAGRLFARDPAPGNWRVGHGFDVHAFGPGDRVALCGVWLPHTHGLIGHSDADVALHALTDALLGTIGDGDIGTHFPPADPQWRDADSKHFLRDAVRRLRAKGGQVANVDVTLICEAPRIEPHREAMRARVASLLGIEVGRVSVKATTSEGLGFTGRREGIAAQAVAMAQFR